MGKVRFMDFAAVPTCDYCIHGHIGYSGDGWNEPREEEFYCDLEDELDTDEMNEAYDGDSRGCSGFKPIMIDKCSECNKPMDIPFYMAKYPDNIFGEVAYCSKECREKADKKFIDL
ncbi:MAG: hypothetical protein AMQ22_00049 [Candidatus Methanofastidiosum methylothiophilum]|uniref:Uncharacterized protein n=1 Tax=Candidatus Methanofastidiosum methylothiophilum TaxID=1705564 RepID=A0A150J9G9_9EURY|nr:MAG: hypothetical protein AMQ22_00049 [Candidatus Methanofastidiosum methylthiophilus]